jgi:hypothetical protein
MLRRTFQSRADRQNLEMLPSCAYVRSRDEVGFRPLDQHEANLFFRLISARCERGRHRYQQQARGASHTMAKSSHMP